MAFARFSEGDVYVYLNTDGLFECCFCGLAGKCFLVETTKEMCDHLLAHATAGHDVPPGCIERLSQEWEENDQWAAARRAAREA